MRFTTITALSLALGACSSAPSAPSATERPEAPIRSTTLHGSDPAITISCQGEPRDAGGELCWHTVEGDTALTVRTYAVPAGDALRRADELVAAVAEHDGPPATRRLYRAGDPTKRFGAGCDAKDATDANTLAPGSPEAAAAAEDGALCVWATWETQGEDVMVSLGRALAYPMGPAPGDGAAKCAPGAKCVPAAAASPPERTYGLTVSRRTTDPRVLARYQAGKDAGIEAVSREMDALIEKMESLDEGAQENAD